LSRCVTQHWEHSQKVAIDIIEKRLKYRNSRRFTEKCSFVFNSISHKVLVLNGGHCYTFDVKRRATHPFRIENATRKLPNLKFCMDLFAQFNMIVRHEIGRDVHIPTSLKMQLFGNAPPIHIAISVCKSNNIAVSVPEAFAGKYNAGIRLNWD
jgi:hypothetical protein